MTVDEAFRLQRALRAPPVLIRLHEACVDTANDLCAGILTRFSGVPIDVEQVLCGAALHDVGKVRVPEELRLPGCSHEAAGEAMLLTAGVPSAIASCCLARTALCEQTPLETMIVALADALWKGERDKLLEQMVADALCARVSDDPVSVWVAVDDLFGRVAREAPRRLAAVEGP